MNATSYKLAAVLVAVAVLGVAGGYGLARHNGQYMHTVNSTASADRKALYWYDPMVPTQHFDKPGKSPFMDMQLVPKYAGEGGDEASIRIDPSIVQNLGVRLTTVERGTSSQPIEAVGSIVFNQRNVAVIQARTNGFVARVYARAPGDVLQRNAALVDLLVPEWAGAQAEFLTLLKNADHDLIDAARERLMLLGMPTDLIKRIEGEKKAQTTVTVRTPIAGAIESLEVREGMTVTAGANLAKINGLETVWIEAAVPETQGGLATLGKSVEARLTTYPADVFKGTVIAVLPEANAETRTLRVRIELPNPQGKLRPGMFAQVRLDGGSAEPALRVASEAVIRSGTRNIVLIADEAGRFTPTEVQTGAEANGKTVILRGLAEGQKVVASGQFLIDSEASLKGVLARLGGGRGSQNAPFQSPVMHEATGKVESVSAENIVVSHGPVASLNWPAMTMGFKPARPEMIASIKPGDRVKIRFEQAGDEFVVTQLTKLGTTP